MAGEVAAQAAALKAILDGVTDIGKTYDYAKLPERGWAPFVAAFSTELASYAGGATHIRAWTLQYVGEKRYEGTTAAIGNTKYKRELQWKVRGYLTVSDTYTSDVVFRDLVEVVADAIDSRPSLAGTCLVHRPVSVTLENGVPRTFGDVVVHYAEISFDAVTITNLATS